MTESIILTLPGRAPAILDATLAELFGTETIRINESRSRNPARFPEDFAFQLTKAEVELLRSQNAMMKEISGLGERLGRLLDTWARYAPWAYTEEGVAQLAGILSTPQAVAASVRTMRLFRETRQHLYVARSAIEDLNGALKQAQTLLLDLNPRLKKVYQCKVLAKLSDRETARALGVGETTVNRDYKRLKQAGLVGSAPTVLQGAASGQQMDLLPGGAA